MKHERVLEGLVIPFRHRKDHSVLHRSRVKFCRADQVSHILKDDQIQILTQGGPAGATRTLLYLYYQYAFEKYNMGEATAVATVLMLLTVGLSVLQFIGSKRWVTYEQ